MRVRSGASPASDWFCLTTSCAPRAGPAALTRRALRPAADNESRAQLRFCAGRRGCPRRGTRSKSPPFGRASAPQRRACEDTAPQKTPSPTATEMSIEALPGRPCHRPSAEEMEVQMVHALTAVLTCVDHGPITGLGDLFLPRD